MISPPHPFWEIEEAPEGGEEEEKEDTCLPAS